MPAASAVRMWRPSGVNDAPLPQQSRKIARAVPALRGSSTNSEVPREKAATSFAALEKQWSDARINREDGLRLDGPDWWLHVRGSNTEPVVRVIAEAPTEDRAKELCDAAGAIVTGKPAPRRLCDDAQLIPVALQ